ncbi:MAG TPA: VCBS repeat-containing protein [Terriglobales bacterium]
MLRSRLLTLTLAVTSLPALAQVNYRHTATDAAVGTVDIVAADFNRDGLPDLAFFQEDGLHVVLNGGGATFSPDKITVLGFGAESLLAVDVNGDQWPDLVMGSVVLINNHDGTFRQGATLSGAVPVSHAIAGDLNGDGKVDLVLPSDDTHLQVFMGDGKGGFVAGQNLALSQPRIYADLLDINSDGKLDLMVVEASKVVLWPGLGNGTFGVPSFIRNPTNDSVQHPIVNAVAADINNDGFPDIVLALLQPGTTSSSPGVNHVFIYRNDGRAHFTRINSFFSGNTSPDKLFSPATLSAGDLNGDGNIDLLFASDSPDHTKTVYVLGNGNGTFGADHSFFPANQVVIRDFTLDGRNDVATRDLGSSQSLDMYVATNGSVNCAPPSSAHLAANICMPSAASAASPLLIRGSGNSPLGVKRVEIWIDGKKAAQKLDNQIGKRFTLAPGTHRIAVVAVDKYLGTATTAKNVTVH